MPEQEKRMVAHLGKVNAAALIRVGAAFDFHQAQSRALRFGCSTHCNPRDW
jgi:hypothetical protein